MDLNLSLLPHQAEFIEDITSRNLGLVGGYGCGKTFCAAAKLVTLACHNIGHELIGLSPTYGMAEKVLVPAIAELLYEQRIPFKPNKSTLVFELQLSRRPTLIHIMAAESYKRAAGLNAAAFLIDELDLIDPDVARAAWRMLTSRLRKGNVYQGCATTTPEGFRFAYQFFVEEVRAKPELAAQRRIIKASTYDNPFLPPDYIPSLLDQYPEQLIKAYLHGEFVNLTTGNVYYAFDRYKNESKLTIKDFQSQPLHIGMDFNTGNMAAVVCVIDGEKTHALEEIVGLQNTEAMCKELRARYGNRQITIYPDSSGKNASANADISSIAILQRAGYTCRYRSKQPPVNDRIASVNARFKSYTGVHRLFVNPVTCPKLTKGLETQGYKDGKPDKSASFGLDHALDAIGYFVEMNWSLSRTNGTVVQPYYGV